MWKLTGDTRSISGNLARFLCDQMRAIKIRTNRAAEKHSTTMAR